jgi:hypothetical protein
VSASGGRIAEPAAAFMRGGAAPQFALVCAAGERPPNNHRQDGSGDGEEQRA